MCSLQTYYSKFPTLKPKQGSPFAPNEDALDLIADFVYITYEFLIYVYKQEDRKSPGPVRWENEVPTFFMQDFLLYMNHLSMIWPCTVVKTTVLIFLRTGCLLICIALIDSSLIYMFKEFKKIPAETRPSLFPYVYSRNKWGTDLGKRTKVTATWLLW